MGRSSNRRLAARKRLLHGGKDQQDTKADATAARRGLGKHADKAGLIFDTGSRVSGLIYFSPAPFSAEGLEWMTVLLGSLQAMPFLYPRLRMCMKGWAKSKPQLLRGGLGNGWWVGVGSALLTEGGCWTGCPHQYCLCRRNLSPGDWPRMHAEPHVSGWLTSLRGGKPRQLCGGCLELLCFFSGPRGGGR